MKRWDIKSAYPMPRQLKEAAEKKRIIKELTEQAQQIGEDPMQWVGAKTNQPINMYWKP